MSRENQGASKSRRQLLKTAGIAGFGLGSLTGSGAADPDIDEEKRREMQREHRRAISEYDELGNALKTVLKDASGLFVGLAEQGYIDSPGVEPFDTSTLVTSRSLQDTEGVLVTSLVYDGTRSAQIRLRTENEDASVELYVQPEFNNAFAMIEEKATGERRKVVESDGPSTNHVEIGHCHDVVEECVSLCYCSPPYAYYSNVTQECCYVPNGRECDPIDSNCTGCSCVNCWDCNS